MDLFGRAFDRWDVCEAYFLFEMEWHGGNGFDFHGKPMGRDTHKRNRPHHHFDIGCQLSRMRYDPRRDVTFEGLSDNGKLIYAGLVKRFGYNWPDDYKMPEEYFGHIAYYGSNEGGVSRIE